MLGRDERGTDPPDEGTAVDPRLGLVRVTLGDHPADEGLALRLRLGAPPVIARIERERVLLDPRTLTDDDVPVIVAALLGIAAELGQEA